MQPLKPEVVNRILQERLLASRFTINPHVAKTAALNNEAESREARIRELHAKLFG
jgi:hypothetical protein